MRSVQAKCVSKKNLSNGVRSLTFTYEGHFEDRSADLDNWNFIIVTADEDEELKIEWLVECEYLENDLCRWKNITIKKYNVNVYGSYVIRQTGRDVFQFGTFDIVYPSLLEEHEGIYLDHDPNSFIEITITIFWKLDEEVLLSLADDFDKFMENQELRDAVFVLGSQEIPAHKQIVSARSAVIEKMFVTDMEERESGRVHIHDVEPNVFKKFLQFIYSGKLETENTDDLLKLLVAGDKYSVKSLVAVCVNKLLENLSVTNAVHILMTAHLVREDFLKIKCMEIIVKNKATVGETDGYKDLIAFGHIDLLSELFLHAV